MSTGNEKAPKQRRKFTAQYRHEAARLVIDSGRTIAEVATELGLGAQLLGKWVKAEKETMTPAPLSANEREELVRLRKENAELRMDNEFLGKAAAFFASKHQ
jgi:transposase